MFGGSLEPAGPNCGFYRDGYCFAGPDDGGVHAVCAEVTSLFGAAGSQVAGDVLRAGALTF